MAFTQAVAIGVWAWGRLVGALAPAGDERTYAFEFDPAWRETGVELAPTTMPTDRSYHTFPHLPERTYHGLPPMVADSLPDDFGSSVLDAHLARQGVDLTEVTPLDRLAYLATRGMGALEFQPDHGPRRRVPTAVDVSALVAASRRAVGGTFQHDDEAEAALAQLIQVGTSAGGARAKAVIAWNPRTDEVQSGQLPAAEGFEHWLLKLDGTGTDGALGATANWGRTEYAYALMAGAAGVDMMPTRLLHEGGRAHFMTKRFDRDGTRKLHVSTLCALAELDFRQTGTHDYAQYFGLVDRLGLGPDARNQAFRRMAFNVIAANCDDHTKNFAFLLPEDGTWQLAPAYDLTHAYMPGNRWIEQHLMSVNGRFREITTADLLTTADRFEVPGARAALSEVLDAVDAWSQFADEADLPDDRAALVASDLVTMRPR